jgi:regulator of protease activity HflC (stomatin/prohibitin superfamily)
MINDEKTPCHMSGMATLVLNIMLVLGSTALIVAGGILLDAGLVVGMAITGLVLGSLYLCLVGPILFAGLKVLKPNEALVFTLFGTYHGCLRKAGF